MLAKLPSEYESRGIIRALRGYVYLYKSKSEESVALGRDAGAMQPTLYAFVQCRLRYEEAPILYILHSRTESLTSFVRMLSSYVMISPISII